MSMKDKTDANPPEAAHWIIRHLSQYEKRFSIEGDLLEVYAYKLDRLGKRRAQMWYWSQTFKALILYWQFVMRGYLDMFGNYFKVSFRNIKRQLGYSFINVFGLAIGIACCILIFTFIRYEMSYDSFHANESSLFRMVRSTKLPGGEQDILAIHPVPLGPALLAEIPQITHAVRLIGGNAVVSYGNKSFGERLLFADSSLFEIFTFPLLKGDPAAVLKEPYAIVLSAAAAMKYFGKEEPLRKILTLNIDGEDREFLVTGVVARIPDNSSLKFDFVLPYEIYPAYDRALTNWRSSRTHTYVKLLDNVKASEVEEKFPAFIDKYFGEIIKKGQEKGYFSSDEDTWRLHLQGIKDIHLDPSVKWGRERTTNPAHLYILSGISLLVLLIACINFITLALGRSTYRVKEVGVRKVLGAVPKQLRAQFLGESLLLSFFALILGMVFASIFLPTFSQLVNADLRIDYSAGGITLLFMVGLMFLVGIIAGSYPALFLSAFRPVDALQAKIKIGGKRIMTKSLVMIQYVLSIFLIISTIVMWRQLNFMRSKPLGYEKDHVLYIQTYTPWQGSEGARLFKVYQKEVAGHPGIINMAGTDSSFTGGWSVDEWEHEGRQVTAFIYRIDSNYLDTLGIELKEGRNFSEKFTSDASEAVIINEALAAKYEWDSPIGQKLLGCKSIEGMVDPVVIGVVKNFHFESLHNEIAPVILHINPSWSIHTILVKIHPENVPQTLAYLRETWQKVTAHKPFEYYFLSDDVDKQYKNEARWSKIISYSSVLAVLISCLGLLGLTSLRVTQRTKEIGIRKILGASASKLVKLISLEFIKLVSMANLLAWPAAYLVMHNWIRNFAYRISIGIWIFLLAAGLALLIALATVCLQSFKAARANPVRALRYE